MIRALLILLILGVPFTAHATDSLSKINAQIQVTEQQNKKLAAAVDASSRDLARTKKKLVRAADRVDDLEERRTDISKKIDDMDAQIKRLDRELAASTVALERAVAAVLFVASHPDFDTENMRDYMLTSAILSGASANLDDAARAAIARRRELDRARRTRAAQKEKLDKTMKKYSAEKNELDKLLSTRAAQNEKLKSQYSDTQKKLRELSARAKSISELSAGVGSSKMSSDTRLSRRKLNLPVRGRVVVRFGEKTALGLRSDGWRIRARTGALVTAPADGEIKFADSFRGFGRVVIMSHTNGYNTVMTNLGDIDVVLGQEVLAGEPIGRMASDKNEMYLEVRRGDKSVDPANLFRE